MQEASLPYLLQSDELAKQLNVHPEKGLSTEEAKARLTEYGPNELKEKKGTSPWILFLEQFNDFIIWVLIGAAVISGLLQEWIDTAVIIAIVILNAVLGFVQEYKAEKSLAALKKLSVPMAKVIRNGAHHVIPSRELVPGDILSLEAGDNVPADARLVREFNLTAQEASLTGESVPVEKEESALEGEVDLAERANMVYQGTSIASGKGTAIVTGTGMQTELGKIASLLQTSQKEVTPLQRRLEKLGKILVMVCLVIIALVFGIGMLKGAHFLEMFMTAVSLAVAAIPEGLPAVVTISLAFGVKKMVKRNALIRKLPSVETLGCATVICSDKTGTLTQNQMTVLKLWADGHLIDVSGTGYEPEGEFLAEGKKPDPVLQSSLEKVLRAGVLCNNAELRQDEEGMWDVIGDPTEGSILTAGMKAGQSKEKLEEEFPMLEEIPFDSNRKMMSVVRRQNSKFYTFVKGAPDVILRHCQKMEEAGKVVPLNASAFEDLMEINENLAGEALRVIGIAMRESDTLPKDISHETIEKDLVFLGLAAMIDPPRPEAKLAVKTCKEAGIRCVMITGDHKNTAMAIARELGFLEPGKEALTGQDVDKISDEELAKRVENITVYARVTAEHKIRIVRAWQSRGEIVAMTGDGVNDAPAIKQADIGVGMGITGTDITKEVSDMVVTDDNFASIVNAVEEGRGIYDNIKKFVNFLLLCNLGEVAVIVIAIILNWRGPDGEIILPLVAVQILWMNLVTDGLPAVALGLDPVNPFAMKRPPRSTKEKIISTDVALNILAISVLLTVATIFAFRWGLEQSVEMGRTMAFTTLVMLQLTCVQLIRSLYSITAFSNPFLWLAIASSFLLQLAVIYTPLSTAFKTTAIHWEGWILIAVLMAGVFAAGKVIFKLISFLTKK